MKKNLQRFLLFLGRFIPIVLTVLFLLFLDKLGEPAHPNLTLNDTVKPKQERVIIFWIDSLAAQDMSPDSPHMPRLKKHLKDSLHGTVQTCVDALSVPCFIAMSTNSDHFSLFALFRNLSSEKGMPDGNVFQLLQKKGYRLGLVGDLPVARAVKGFDWVEVQKKTDDALSVRKGLEALEKEQLSLLIIHLHTTDKNSHIYGATSPEYTAALELDDQLIEATRAKLRPNDHLIVLGDHGHTADGRHFTGLYVPTFAAFFGPKFKRALEYPMHITDHGVLWAKIFDINFGKSDWVDAYFAGNELPNPEETAQPTDNSNISFYALLVLLAFSFLVIFPLKKNWFLPQQTRLSVWRSYIVLALTLFSFGIFWTQIRPFIYGSNFFLNAPIVICIGALGALFLLSFFPYFRAAGIEKSTAIALLMLLGGIFFAPATVYKQGGVFCALTLFICGLFVSLIQLIKKRLWRQALLCLFTLALAASIWNPSVGNFAVQRFMFYTDIVGKAQGLFVISFSIFILFFAAWPEYLALSFRGLRSANPNSSLKESRRWLIAGLLGFCAALGKNFLPSLFYLLPCVLALPTLFLAHRKAKFGPLAFFCAFPALAFFFQFNVHTLAPVTAAILLWPLWAYVRKESTVYQRAAELVVLAWAMLWTSMGCRINGINFNYFFKWLPEGANFKSTWALQGVFTVLLYSVPTLLGILLANRAVPNFLENSVKPAWRLARFKLSFVFLFIIGFTLHHKGAGPFLISDVWQEAITWMLIVFFLSFGSHQVDKNLST